MDTRLRSARAQTQRSAIAHAARRSGVALDSRSLERRVDSSARPRRQSQKRSCCPAMRSATLGRCRALENPRQLATRSRCGRLVPDARAKGLEQPARCPRLAQERLRQIAVDQEAREAIARHCAPTSMLDETHRTLGEAAGLDASVAQHEHAVAPRIARDALLNGGHRIARALERLDEISVVLQQHSGHAHTRIVDLRPAQQLVQLGGRERRGGSADVDELNEIGG